MKSAYELAMERLNKASPSARLTPAQKARIAELESKYKAQIAGREIAMKDEIARAGDPDKAAQLQQQLAQERAKLQAELDEKKEAVRRG
jgi:small-conductance mechanosensitive channel